MPKTRSTYGVHPAVLMTQKWVAELKEKTGRSMDEWIAYIQKSGPKSEDDRRAWLKTKQGLGTNSANWLTGRASGRGGEFETPEAYLRAAEQYVDAMFSGPKQALRPIYDELLRISYALGPDVKGCPCQTMVPIYRKHVIAQIKPTTRTRVDFGFALGARPAEGRLVDTGGYAKKDRITHRIGISSLSDIDAEVKRWLRVAYDADK
jgi:Domain of unknown function (DUF5655)/Domain of unknown function (DUF4287)